MAWRMVFGGARDEAGVPDRSGDVGAGRMEKWRAGELWEFGVEWVGRSEYVLEWEGRCCVCLLC